MANNSKLIKALKKVTAQENAFQYFPPDEMEELVKKEADAKATMKNVMENIQERKMHFLAVINAVDIAVPQIKQLLKEDVSIKNLEKFDKIMEIYYKAEKRVFDEVKHYH